MNHNGHHNHAGQTALITGASSGIGYELSKLFAANGFNLVLVARRVEKLNQLAAGLIAAHGIQAAAYPVDLSDPAAPKVLFAALEQQGLKVDVLVNNAGFGVHGAFAELDLDQELAMLQVNVVSLVQLTRLFLPGMLARGYGRIMNVGSTGSFGPAPLMAVYGASKAFVLSFTEALSEELRGTRVRVTALCPGVTITGFQQAANAEGMRLGNGPSMTAEAVARQGYEALMNGRVVVVPGLHNQLLVQSIRFSPRAVTRWLSHRLMQREAA